jgi:hypothetical protein
VFGLHPLLFCDDLKNCWHAKKRCLNFQIFVFLSDDLAKNAGFQQDGVLF